MKAIITVVLIVVLGLLAWRFWPLGGSKAATQAAVSALVNRFETSERYVEVVSVEKKDWPDSCLGLPKKDEVCSQVVTPGYEVKLHAESEDKFYRTNEDGTIVRAAN